MKNKNTVLYLLSGVVSLVFLVYVLINLDWTILLSAFSNLQWGWLMLALLAYLINIFLRAIRFANLIYTKKIDWQEFIPVSALHNILMYLLPAKTGDVTYIFLAKNRLDISLPEGTATLFASRFYDFSVVALILAILLPFSKENMPDWIYQSAILFCLITLFCAIAIFIFLKRNTNSASTVENDKTLSSKIKKAWGKFMGGLREIQANGLHWKTTFLTVGVWLCIYANFYFATRSMDLAISFYHIVIISIVMIPLTLLPIQGFANIGTHEIGWTSVLIAFGYPYQIALSIAAGTHFILLVSVLFSGGVALLLGNFVKSNMRNQK